MEVEHRSLVTINTEQPIQPGDETMKQTQVLRSILSSAFKGSRVLAACLTVATLALAFFLVPASTTSAKKPDPPPPCPVLPAGSTTTVLLFPFVTNQAGFDTALTIANTSLDTVGTPPQTGTCTISYFGNTTGGGAAPAAQTTQAVPAGATLIFTLSNGGNLGVAATPGFQGYIMVTCNFQYAHGFTFISDLGAQRLATSYLALVVPASGRNPCGETLSQ